jgi:hypothetical protein
VLDRVLLRTLPVDALGTVFARSAECFTQPFHVDVMGQGGESSVLHLPGHRRYPFEFR